jgi:REP element-mobilizing transposase RayT/ribosomal protein S13
MGMARPLRIEYPGAVYHVICRGNNRQAIFRDDQDRKRYLEKLSLYCQEKKVDLMAYCLLSNHVHVLLETPEGNLSKMMQALQTSYTLHFNRRHGRTGHVFEQRYKAMLVDKDNYLLQVSRYIHLNPVEAKLAERPQDYRWSSYGSYLKGKGIAGSKAESVLDYFTGSKSRRVEQYREFVEGKRGERVRNLAPEVRKQIFIGDEEFEGAVQRKMERTVGREVRPTLKRIVQAVSEVTGKNEAEMRGRQRSKDIKRCRELVCYLGRRHGEVGLEELRRFLQVRELSTASHAVRRAEARLGQESGFRRLLDHTLRQLDYDIQA